MWRPWANCSHYYWWVLRRREQEVGSQRRLSHHPSLFLSWLGSLISLHYARFIRHVPSIPCPHTSEAPGVDVVLVHHERLLWLQGRSQGFQGWTCLMYNRWNESTQVQDTSSEGPIFYHLAWFAASSASQHLSFAKASEVSRAWGHWRFFDGPASHYSTYTCLTRTCPSLTNSGSWAALYFFRVLAAYCFWGSHHQSTYCDWQNYSRLAFASWHTICRLIKSLSRRLSLRAAGPLALKVRS